jgi:hypothetical protein
MARPLCEGPLCKRVLSVCNEGWKYPKKDHVGLVALQGEIRKQILLTFAELWVANDAARRLQLGRV